MSAGGAALCVYPRSHTSILTIWRRFRFLQCRPEMPGLTVIWCMQKAYRWGCVSAKIFWGTESCSREQRKPSPNLKHRVSRLSRSLGSDENINCRVPPRAARR